jgi:hypothetical protein
MVATSSARLPMEEGCLCGPPLSAVQHVLWQGLPPLVEADSAEALAAILELQEWPGLLFCPLRVTSHLETGLGGHLSPASARGVGAVR